MNEYGFIRYIHSKLESPLQVWKIHDSYQGGVPDAFYLGPKGTLWIEYKYVKALPVRDSTTIKTCLTEQQRIWLDKLHEARQPCALVIGCGNQSLILVNGQWRDDSLTRTDFLTRAVSRADLIEWIKSACLKTPKKCSLSATPPERSKAPSASPLPVSSPANHPGSSRSKKPSASPSVAEIKNTARPSSTSLRRPTSSRRTSVIGR